MRKGKKNTHILPDEGRDGPLLATVGLEGLGLVLGELLLLLVRDVGALLNHLALEEDEKGET